MNASGRQPVWVSWEKVRGYHGLFIWSVLRHKKEQTSISSLLPGLGHRNR